MNGLCRRIQELADQHGSLRAAARVLKIDPGYLCRLMDGSKVQPSDAILRKLGLKRVVMYVPRNTPEDGEIDACWYIKRRAR